MKKPGAELVTGLAPDDEAGRVVLGRAAELPTLHAGKVGTVLEKKPRFISHPEKKNNS